MSFQSYLDTVERQTGKSPADLRKLVEEKGFTVSGILVPGTRATAVTDWLKSDLGLGHGHAMAVYALLKGSKREGDA